MFLRLLFPFILLFSEIFPQSAWEVLNPLPQEKTINALQIVNDSIVFAAGENGAFLRSHAYGSGWDRLPLNTSVSLMSLYFSDAQNGWLGARGGKLYRTTDGGYNFQIIKEFTGRDIIKIFVNGNSGYICTREGEFLRTTDGFSTVISSSITSTETISGIEFRPSGKGYAVSENGSIFSTSDNGATWNKISFTAGVPLYSIKFLNENVSVVAGYNGFVSVSTDAGTNWNTTAAGNSAIKSISADGSGGILLVSISGIVYRSNDAGATWNAIHTGDEASYRVIDAKNNFLITAGEYGIISASTDGGSQWTYKSTGSRVRFNKIKFIDQNYGWIIGDKGLVLMTSDGGDTWKKQISGTDKELFDVFIYKDALGAISLWMVGARGTHLISYDSGNTFRRGPIDTMTTFNLRAINMSKVVSRVVGDAGTLFESADKWGTAPWRRRNAFPSTLILRDIAATSTRAGYIIGDGGAIYRIAYRNFGINAGTSSGDSTWDQPYDLRSISFYGSSYGWIVGEHGIVLKTVNGGYFINVANLNASLLNSVHFPNLNSGLTVGANGKAFKSSDGGVNWRELYTGVTGTLNSAYMLTTSKFYAVGASGILIRTNTGGELPSAAGEKSAEPNQLLLKVFPNPVTSELSGNAVIKYRVPESGAYRIELFDPVGRSAGTLHSGDGKGTEEDFIFVPANYNLSSGMYIISLSTPAGRVNSKFLYLK